MADSPYLSGMGATFNQPPPYSPGRFGFLPQINAPLAQVQASPMLGGMGPSNPFGMFGQLAYGFLSPYVDSQIMQAGGLPGQIFGRFNYLDMARSQQFYSGLGAARGFGHPFDVQQTANLVNGVLMMAQGPNLSPQQIQGIEAEANNIAQNIQRLGGLTSVLATPQGRNFITGGSPVVGELISQFFGNQVMAQQVFTAGQIGRTLSPDAAGKLTSALSDYYFPGGRADVTRTFGFNQLEIGDLVSEVARRGAFPGILDVPTPGRAGFERDVKNLARVSNLKPEQIETMLQTPDGQQQLQSEVGNINAGRVTQMVGKYQELLKATRAMSEILGPNASMERLMQALEELTGNSFIADPARARRIASSITETAKLTKIPTEVVANLAVMGAQQSEIMGLDRSVGANAALSALASTTQLYQRAGAAGSFIPESMGRVQSETMNRFMGEQGSVSAQRLRNLIAITQGADPSTFSPAMQKLLSDIQVAGTDSAAADRVLSTLRNTQHLGQMMADSGLADSSGNASQLLESKYLGLTLSDDQQRLVATATGGINRANESLNYRSRLAASVQSTLGLLGTELNVDEASEAGQEAFQTIQESSGDEAARLRQLILKRAGGERGIRRALSRQGLSGRQISSRLKNIDAQINEIIAETQSAVGSPERMRAMQAGVLQAEAEETVQRNVNIRQMFSDAGIGNESLLQRMFDFVRTASPGSDIRSFINYAAGIPSMTSGTVEQNAETMREIVTESFGGTDMFRRYRGAIEEQELAGMNDPAEIMKKYLPVMVTQSLKKGKLGESARDSLSKLMRQGPGAVPLVLAEAYQQMMERHKSGEPLDKLKKDFAPLFGIMKDQGYDEATLREAASKIIRPPTSSAAQEFVGPPAPTDEERKLYPADSSPPIPVLPPPPDSSQTAGSAASQPVGPQLSGKSDQPKSDEPMKVVIVGVDSSISIPVSTGPREAE